MESPQSEHDDLVDALHRLPVLLRRNVQVQRVPAGSGIGLGHKLVGEMTGIGPR